MFDLIRSRLREERGFTLIELLVVMIIIAILMAVAVPVFLGQKQKALATNAKTNVKNVYDAIESCGASTANGALIDTTGGAPVNCTTQAMVEVNEPSLSRLFGATSCGTGACIVISNGTADGYTITGRTTGTDPVSFVLERSATGVRKTCSGAAAVMQRMCPATTW